MTTDLADNTAPSDAPSAATARDEQGQRLLDTMMLRGSIHVSEYVHYAEALGCTWEFGNLYQTAANRAANRLPELPYGDVDEAAYRSTIGLLVDHNDFPKLPLELRKKIIVETLHSASEWPVVRDATDALVSTGLFRDTEIQKHVMSRLRSAGNEFPNLDRELDTGRVDSSESDTDGELFEKFAQKIVIEQLLEPEFLVQHAQEMLNGQRFHKVRSAWLLQMVGETAPETPVVELLASAIDAMTNTGDDDIRDRLVGAMNAWQATHPDR